MSIKPAVVCITAHRRERCPGKQSPPLAKRTDACSAGVKGNPAGLSGSAMTCEGPWYSDDPRRKHRGKLSQIYRVRVSETEGGTGR